MNGVVELRTLQDSIALRARLQQSGGQVVIIGAGFIGLEVAATARQLGCTVTVLEAAAAPLMRGLGAEMGAAAATVHRQNGVDLRCEVGVSSIERLEVGAAPLRVHLEDGSVVAADVVVVGIGVSPSTDWLASSGISLRDGVVCDDSLWTGVPGVFAAGDCARWHNHWFDPHDDAQMRVEHWTNAAEQGPAAARNLLAASRGEALTPFESVPFVWSDQFDRRIQVLGRPHGDDEVLMVRGDEAGPFAALYGHAGRLRAVLSVSMPKVMMPFRRLMSSKPSWAEALELADSLPV